MKQPTIVPETAIPAPRMAKEPELGMSQELNQSILVKEIWNPFMRCKRSKKAFQIHDAAGRLSQNEAGDFFFFPVHEGSKPALCRLQRPEPETVCRKSIDEGCIIFVTGVLSAEGLEIHAAETWAKVREREPAHGEEFRFSKEQLTTLDLRREHSLGRRMNEKNPGGILFSTLMEFQTLYNDHAEIFPPEIRQVIKRQLLSVKRASTKEKAGIIKVLQCLTNVDYYDSWHIEDADLCMAQLAQSCYLRPQLAPIFQRVISQQAAGRGGFKRGFLLVGPKGCGKKSQAKALYAAVGLPLVQVIAGKTDSSAYIGSATIYDNCQLGSIMSKAAQENTTSLGFLIQDVDKMPPPSTSGNMWELVYSLAEGKINDEALNFPFTLQNCMVIAIADSLEKVPPELKSALQVVELPAYTKQEKAELFRDYIFPAQMAENPLFKDSVGVTDAACRLIASEYSGNCGAEELAAHAAVLAETAAAILRKEPFEFVEIDENMVQQHLEKTPHRHSKNIAELRREYEQNPQRYSPKIDAAIQNLLADYLEETKEAERREIVDTMDYLIPVDWTGSASAPLPGLAQIKAALETGHIGDPDVIRELIGVAAEMRHTGKMPQAVLLVGPPGTGKTSLFKLFAAALGKPFRRISLGGAARASVITGLPHSVNEALPGEPLRAIRNVGTADSLILLDELDKLCGCDQPGSPADALLPLLDGLGARDRFIGEAEIDYSKVSWCATANTLDTVPRALLDRFQVIALPGCTPSEKRDILENATLPGLYREMQLQKTDVVWSETAKELLVKDYAVLPGARDLAELGRKTMRQALVALELEPERRPFTVDSDFLRGCLGKPVVRDSFPDREHLRPGVARVMAVNGYCGCTFPLEAVVRPAQKHEMTTTGLPRKEVQDSCNLADHVVREWLAQKGILDREQQFSVWMHWGDAGVEKGGPSAGVAAAVALLSAYTGTVAPSCYCYTGEINLGGDVCAVGSLKEKLSAAAQVGCTTAFIPAAGLEAQLLAKLETMLEVKPVTRLDEVFETVFPHLSAPERQLLA